MRSDDESDGPADEPVEAGISTAALRIYIWHVMGFAAAEIAAHLDISARDVATVLARRR